MSPEEFAEYLVPGYEGRGYEFKGALSRADAVFFAKVTRAALGMANQVGGGLILIGVDEDENGHPIATGLTDQLLATWTYDDVAAGFAPAADPRLTFSWQPVRHNEKSFVVLRIDEFETIPVICAREYNHQGHSILRRGALYVRSRGKPETSEVPSQTEMRELLDLAVDKGIRSFLARMDRVGIQLPADRKPADVEKFSAELTEPDG